VPENQATVKVVVNPDRCEGNMRCVLAALTVFALHDDDRAGVLIKRPGDDLRPKVEASTSPLGLARISASARVSRLELRVMFDVLLPRFSDITLVGVVERCAPALSGASSTSQCGLRPRPDAYAQRRVWRVG